MENKENKAASRKSLRLTLRGLNESIPNNDFSENGAEEEPSVVLEGIYHSDGKILYKVLRDEILILISENLNLADFEGDTNFLERIKSELKISYDSVDDFVERDFDECVIA